MVKNLIILVTIAVAVGALAFAEGGSPPVFPTELDLNLLNPNGSNIDTSLPFTIDYLDGNSYPRSRDSINNSGTGFNGTVFWGIYYGKSNLYTLLPAKGGTDINITIEGFETLMITAVEAGYVSGDYNLNPLDTTPPTITIYSPTNTTYTTASLDLNVSADEAIDTWTYNLNSDGNITFTPNTTITGVEGLNNIVVYSNDTAGNTNSSSVDFEVAPVTVNYTDNQPERGNVLSDITSDDVYASLVESDPPGTMDVTFSSNLIPEGEDIMQFDLSIQHYESDSDIELKAYYMPGNGSTWTEITPAPTVSEGNETTYTVDLKALGIDTPGKANGIKIRWEAIRSAGPNDITYVDLYRIDYSVAGRLNVNLITPIDNADWAQNQSYWINATVACEGYANAVCGNVTGTVRYNKSAATPDTAINMTSGATPFYIKENVKPVDWVDLSAYGGQVTDPENATDNDAGDETTKADIYCDFCDNASVKYVWDTTANGNSDVSLYYIWETFISETNVYIEAWNFSSTAWDQLLYIEYDGADSRDIRKVNLDRDYINSTGGIEILFKANDSTDSTTINLYDVWVNIHPSGNSGINPDDLACLNLNKGDSCQLNWLVDAAGNQGESYEIEADFTSSYVEVAEKDTADATVIIANPP